MYKTNEEIIVIQAKATAPIPTGVVFWSHDKGTAKMLFQLQKDYVNQTLSEGTIVPICLDFVGGRHIYHAVIEDAVNGIVSIVLEDNILGYVGHVTGSIYIELTDSRSLDTAGRFTFDIKRSPIDENVPELEDYYWQGFNEIMNQYHETSNKLFDDLNNTQVKLNEIFNAIEENKVLLKSEADIFFAKKTDLTKENIGLGNVDNYSTATQAEAEAGESNSVFMTPKTVFQAIAKWVQGKFVSTTGNETILGTKNFQDGLQTGGLGVQAGMIERAITDADRSDTTNVTEVNGKFFRIGNIVILTMGYKCDNYPSAATETRWIVKVPDGFKRDQGYPAQTSLSITRNASQPSDARAYLSQVSMICARSGNGNSYISGVWATKDPWPSN